jgi:hypothetical protein
MAARSLDDSVFMLPVCGSKDKQIGHMNMENDVQHELSIRDGDQGSLPYVSTAHERARSRRQSHTKQVASTSLCASSFDM